MTPEILLERLHAHGVTLKPAPDGRLRLIAERRPPTELIEAARQYRPALLRMLGSPEAPESPEPPDARSAGEILADAATVFGPGLRLIVGGLDAPARPRPTGRTRRRSPRTGDSGGPPHAA